MARHQSDLVLCARLPGVAVGRVCAAHDGRCVACDSMVRPCAVARVCDGCGYGSGSGSERCVVCGVREGGGAVADAHYCVACVRLEKDLPRRLPCRRQRRDGHGRLVLPEEETWIQ